jgi:hypothetical protein
MTETCSTYTCPKPVQQLGESNQQSRSFVPAFAVLHHLFAVHSTWTVARVDARFGTSFESFAASLRLTCRYHVLHVNVHRHMGHSPVRVKERVGSLHRSILLNTDTRPNHPWLEISMPENESHVTPSEENAFAAW